MTALLVLFALMHNCCATEKGNFALCMTPKFMVRKLPALRFFAGKKAPMGQCLIPSAILHGIDGKASPTKSGQNIALSTAMNLSQMCSSNATIFAEMRSFKLTFGLGKVECRQWDGAVMVKFHTWRWSVLHQWRAFR